MGNAIDTRGADVLSSGAVKSLKKGTVDSSQLVDAGLMSEMRNEKVGSSIGNWILPAV
jgi:hypothetical protein